MGVSLDWLKRICERLVQYDPEIIEVVQFGSSVYAPEYAKDVDLLVITRREKAYGGYLDASNPEDILFDVDIVVLEVGKSPTRGFLRNVSGAFKVLYGDGKSILKYVETLGDPTFDEARSSLRVANILMDQALKTENKFDRDRLIREAFDALFNAARIASMTYLSGEVSRWGLIRRSMPEPYKGEFEAFISILHLKYFYNGEYPKESVEEEFSNWFRRVEVYVQKTESDVKGKK